jgi:hypothetical protein
MARALCQEKKHKRHIVQLIHLGRDPNLQPKLVTSYACADGQIWEVWEISYTLGTPGLRILLANGSEERCRTGG